MEIGAVAGESPRERDVARKRLYEREEALLKRLQVGEDTPEVQAELASVREAIRRSLRHEDGGGEDDRSP
jgi:chaperonin cofactor prefoldin